MPGRWLLVGLLISAFTIVAVPVFFIGYDSFRYARHGRAPQNPWTVAAGVIAFFLAFTVFVTLGVNSPAIRDNLRRDYESSTRYDKASIAEVFRALASEISCSTT